MSVELINKGEVLTALLSEEIDHHSAKGIREKIDAALELNNPKLLVLDFSGVTFMDSSGIGLVMGRYAKLSKSGGGIHLTNMPFYIRKLMTLGGIEKIATMDKERIN